MDFHRRILAKILQLRSFLTGVVISRRKVPTANVKDGDKILIERYDRIGDAVITLEVLSWTTGPQVTVDFVASPWNEFVFRRLRKRKLGSITVGSIFVLPSGLTVQWQGMRKIKVLDTIRLFRGLIIPFFVPLWEEGFGARYTASVFFTQAYLKLYNVLKGNSRLLYSPWLQQYAGFYYPYMRNTRLVFANMFRMLGLKLVPRDEWDYRKPFGLSKRALEHHHLVFSLNATEHRVYSYDILLRTLRYLARKYDILVLPKHNPSEKMRHLEDDLRSEGIPVAPERDLFDQAIYSLHADLYVGFDSGPFHLHHHGSNAVFLSSRGAAFAWAPLVLREPYEREATNGVWQLWVGKSKKHTKAIVAPLGLKCIPCYELGCNTRGCTRPDANFLARSIEHVFTTIS